jgi:hypothetical protein
MPAVLKTAEPQGSEGSNPSLSAITKLALHLSHSGGAEFVSRV